MGEQLDDSHEERDYAKLIACAIRDAARIAELETLLGATLIAIGDGDPQSPDALTLRVIEEVCKREGYLGRGTDPLPLASWIIRCARKAATAEAAREAAEAKVIFERQCIENANAALFEVPETDDPEHQITCHADTLPDAYRRAAKAVNDALTALQVSIQAEDKS